MLRSKIKIEENRGLGYYDGYIKIFKDNLYGEVNKGKHTQYQESKRDDVFVEEEYDSDSFYQDCMHCSEDKECNILQQVNG